MPYEIIHRGKWIVKKKGAFGRVFGRHDTEAAAKKQLAAIHANSNEGSGGNDK